MTIRSPGSSPPAMTALSRSWLAIWTGRFANVQGVFSTHTKVPSATNSAVVGTTMVSTAAPRKVTVANIPGLSRAPGFSS